MEPKTRRGFAAMDQEKQRSIASKGGRAAHQKGTAHQFTSDEARAAGRKGGEAVSRNRTHMSAIGRKGGEAVSRDRAHMSRIGREAGQAARANRKMPENSEESLSTSEEQAATAHRLHDGQAESSYVGNGPGSVDNHGTPERDGGHRAQDAHPADAAIPGVTNRGG
jgi:general stress protein YciG